MAVEKTGLRKNHSSQPNFRPRNHPRYFLRSTVHPALEQRFLSASKFPELLRTLEEQQEELGQDRSFWDPRDAASDYSPSDGGSRCPSAVPGCEPDDLPDRDLFGYTTVTPPPGDDLAQGNQHPTFRHLTPPWSGITPQNRQDITKRLNRIHRTTTRLQRRIAAFRRRYGSPPADFEHPLFDAAKSPASASDSTENPPNIIDVLAAQSSSSPEPTVETFAWAKPTRPISVAASPSLLKEFTELPDSLINLPPPTESPKTSPRTPEFDLDDYLQLDSSPT